MKGVRSWCWVAVATPAVLAAGVAAQTPNLAVERARLVIARHDAAAATARADALARAAATERDAAARARAQEAALAARVAGAEAEVAAATARVRLVDVLLVRQRGVLARAQVPAARLLAALQSLARRPALAAVAQPGSVDDLVHLRAVLGQALPVIRARTAGVRAALDRARRLRADATLAATALRAGRVRLEGERTALARLEREHRRRSAAFGRGALSEGDRALALGEQARDLVDRLAEAGTAQAVAADLAALPGPEPRPLAPGTVTPPLPHVYRLPVAGRVVTGFGELSPAGFRSRGITLAVAGGAAVRAPARGRIVYAAPFRHYGVVVILDHGAGWTTLVSGLATAPGSIGRTVAAGATIGRMSATADCQVTIELRRRGRPVDLAAMIG